ncbi:hypothetical protein [Nonomuraea sp. NPDC050310]
MRREVRRRVVLLCGAQPTDHHPPMRREAPQWGVILYDGHAH